MNKYEFMHKYKRVYAKDNLQDLINGIVNQALTELYALQTYYKPSSYIKLKYLQYLVPMDEKEREENIKRIIYEINFLLDNEVHYQNLLEDLHSI